LRKEELRLSVLILIETKVEKRFSHNGLKEAQITVGAADHILFSLTSLASLSNTHALTPAKEEEEKEEDSLAKEEEVEKEEDSSEKTHPVQT
jgi:hypothetical protein